nr:MAG TPA: hypothetical protein [Microviridae sp.]
MAIFLFSLFSFSSFGLSGSVFVSYLLESSVRPGIVRVFFKFKCYE